MPELTHRIVLTTVIGAAVVLLGGALYFGGGAAPAPLPEAASAGTIDAVIVVHVSGAVRHPGLVSLQAQARIADAVNAAGGAAGNADLGAINLAGPVGDGDQIVVPVIGDAEGAADGVDLNRASAQDLAGLHGIGPVLADRIVAYRDEHGRFESVEDLLDVPGIGEAKLALLRPGVASP